MNNFIEAQDRLADARCLIGVILHLAEEDWGGPSDETHAVAMASQDKVELALALLAKGRKGGPVAVAARKLAEAACWLSGEIEETYAKQELAA